MDIQVCIDIFIQTYRHKYTHMAHRFLDIGTYRS